MFPGEACGSATGWFHRNHGERLPCVLSAVRNAQSYGPLLDTALQRAWCLSFLSDPCFPFSAFRGCLEDTRSNRSKWRTKHRSRTRAWIPLVEWVSEKYLKQQLAYLLFLVAPGVASFPNTTSHPLFFLLRSSLTDSVISCPPWPHFLLHLMFTPVYFSPAWIPPDISRVTNKTLSIYLLVLLTCFS